MSAQIIYDKKVQVIRVNGENLIDLSSVKYGSKATLYSKRGSEQDIAFEAIFNFHDNELFPFSLDALSLTPASFIRTLVENGLLVVGLECSGEFAKAYRVIKSKHLTIS